MPPRSVNIRWRKELPPNQANLNVLCCVIVSGLSLQNVTEHNHSSDFSSENMMNMTKGLYSTKKKKQCLKSYGWRFVTLLHMKSAKI